nr:MAG TPA: hypothetical protein [Caudoviricetes sp.]
MYHLRSSYTIRTFVWLLFLYPFLLFFKKEGI